MKVVYRNVKGGAPKTIKVGYADITISDYCQPETSVIVDEYKGSGANYEKREQPLLYVTLNGEQLFNGTLVELKRLLTPNKEA